LFDPDVNLYRSAADTLAIGLDDVLKSALPLPITRHVMKVSNFLYENYWNASGEPLVGIPVGASPLVAATTYELSSEVGTIPIIKLTETFTCVPYTLSDEFPLTGDVRVIDTGTGKAVYRENHPFSGNIRVTNGLIYVDFSPSVTNTASAPVVGNYLRAWDGSAWKDVSNEACMHLSIDGLATGHVNYANLYNWKTYPVKITPDEVVIRMDCTNRDFYMLGIFKRGMPFWTLELHAKGHNITGWNIWTYEQKRFVGYSNSGTLTDFRDWLYDHGESSSQDADNVYLRFGPRGSATGGEARTWVLGWGDDLIWFLTSNDRYTVDWNNWNPYREVGGAGKEVQRFIIGAFRFPTRGLWNEGERMTLGTGVTLLMADPASGSTNLVYVSNSASDTQGLSLTGIDSAGNLTYESVTLNGTTPVNGTVNFTKILYVDLESSAVGGIQIRDSLGNVLYTIPAGGNYEANGAQLDTSGEAVSETKTMATDIPYGIYKLAVFYKASAAVAGDLRVRVIDVGVGDIVNTTFDTVAGRGRVAVEVNLSTATVTNVNKQIQIEISKATATANTITVDCYAFYPYKRNADSPKYLMFAYDICRSSLHDVKVAEPANRYFEDHVRPLADNIFDIGGSSLRWRNEYLSGNLTLSSLTSGSVLFAGSGGLISQDNANLYWDNTNKRLGIGTSSPTAKLDVNGSTGYNQLRLRISYTPTGTSDPNGNVGDIAWDDNYIYVKTSAGWKRAALSTW
jgi:hypothetical protein